LALASFIIDEPWHNTVRNFRGQITEIHHLPHHTQTVGEASHHVLLHFRKENSINLHTLEKAIVT
jgi:hypothetical protein